MFDARTMAVRSKVIGGTGRRRRRVFGGSFGDKMIKEVEGVEAEGIEGMDVGVLRPVRNRRWQF
jgi:hypothetical protein